MPLLSATNLNLAYGHRTILENVSFSIEAGERVGIVGKNGGGKSSFMKLLAGLAKPDSGDVSLARGARAGYLHQDPVLDPAETLRGEAEAAFEHLHNLHRQLDQVFHDMADAQGDALDALLKQQVRLEEQINAAGGYAIDHKVDATLHGLGFTDAQFTTPVKGLSGGQKGRLSLAKLLLQQPDVLLLDEPTNHLDIAGRLWLERFLVDEFPGAVLLISHDRYLLDGVVHRIVELEQCRLIDYPGNYEAFVEIRAQRRLSQLRAFENQQTRFKSEEAFIRRYRAGQRAKQAQGRLSRLTREKEDALERPIEHAAFKLELPKAPRSGEIVVSARGLSKQYPDAHGGVKTLFKELDLKIERGERWGIVGPNGAGKTTIVRVLLGELAPDDGSSRLGSNLAIGHYHQSHEHLDPNKTVIQHLQSVILKEVPGAGFSEQQARNLAGVFLFSGDEQDRTLGTLSGGERSRAVLAGLLASAKNLLVLDEPTNHLDIMSAERLEDALAAPDPETGEEGYEGTIILISHDRALIDSTCEHLLVLDGQGGAEVFHGNWTEWNRKQGERAKAQAKAQSEAKARKEQAEQQRKEAEARKLAAQPETRAAAAKPASKPGARSGGGKGKFGRFSTEQIELKMNDAQAKIASIDEQLASPDVWKDKAKSNDLQDRRELLQRELAELELEYLQRME
jgi:ATP-binding cassette subfamily F protein 3